ncbi:hypothetical protein PY650_21270 [Rhizobium calliandrae]|uniref:Uncharacterized protein n=1 Tax=Rhizobium calliandrae TaxID=1312182 RepID=A0ABT7KHL6_9HYPH|nr:hypothetical protein [Rhizobium calliandrae]MDL2408134.1 hypothetical protein [Rhizobium calliandrae]
MGHNIIQANGSTYYDTSIHAQYFAQVLNLYNLATQVYVTEHSYKNIATTVANASDGITGGNQAIAQVEHNLAPWDLMSGILGGAAEALASRGTKEVPSGLSDRRPDLLEFHSTARNFCNRAIFRNP